MEPINKQAPFYTGELPEGSPRITKNYDSTKCEYYFPFILYKDGTYLISVECEMDEKVWKTYEPIFHKHDFSGGGFSWATLIQFILKKENQELLERVDLDPESGGFYLFADCEKSQRDFVNYMGKVLNDTVAIGNYLAKATSEGFRYDPSKSRP